MPCFCYDKYMQTARAKLIVQLLIWVLALSFVSLATYQLTMAYGQSQINDGQVKLFYSLDSKENDKELINVIDHANKYIYFAIYTFTKDNIADALIRAKERGVQVSGIIDLSQSKTASEVPLLQKLKDAGIDFKPQKHKSGIMHIKALVTENDFALGSYNWTEAATFENDEILEIGQDHNLHDQVLRIIKEVIDNN